MFKRVLEYEAKTIKAKGINGGAIISLVSLVCDDILSVADAALRAKLSEEEFLTKMKQYNQQLTHNAYYFDRKAE